MTFDLEIGFGLGNFLLDRAKNFPERTIVGIEIKHALAKQVRSRCDREALRNARALGGDVHRWLESKPLYRFQTVFINFPDPWWKKRHQERVLIQAPFLNRLESILEPGAKLFIQTDVEMRHEQYTVAIRDAGWRLERVGHFDHQHRAKSNRELRADKDGLPYFRIEALLSNKGSLGTGDAQT